MTTPVQDTNDRPWDSIVAVTFDATGTLFHSPHRAAVYADVLERHGRPFSVATRASLSSTLDTVWQEMACGATPHADRFSSHTDGARGFWRRYLDRVCALLDLPAPSRFAAAELFHRFASAEPWEVFGDVVTVLDALVARGYRLGVLSNWDERLPEVLSSLGLRDHFAVVVTSVDVGCEKPDARLFEQGVAALGVSAERTLHVGDRQLEDVEGAEAAGLQAWRVDRPEAGLDVLLTELGVCGTTG